MGTLAYDSAVNNFIITIGPSLRASRGRAAGTSEEPVASSSSVHIEDAGWSPTESVQMGALPVSQALIYMCDLPCLWGLKLGPTNGHCGGPD